jgi:hypothetical protein
MKKLLLCVALLLGAQAAVADDATYGYYTVGYTFGQIKGGGVSLDVGDLGATLGWTPYKWLALEVGGMFGVSDANVAGVKIKLDSNFMVAVVPTLPLSDDWSLFAKVGYAETKLKASDGYSTLSGSDHDTAFGVGLQYARRYGDYRFGGRLEYLQYYDKDGIKISGTTLSFIQQF